MLKTEISKIFQERRNRAAKSLQGGTLILPGARELVRNNDVHFEFRQLSDFYYLTGFEEPDAWLILRPLRGDQQKYESVLLVHEREPLKEVWTGEIYGTDRAQSLFRFDKVYPLTELESVLRQTLQSAQQVHYRLGLDPLLDHWVLKVLEGVREAQGRKYPPNQDIIDPSRILFEMRSIKDAEEIEHMRHAAKLSAAAHLKLMERFQPGMTEFEAQAIIEYEFKTRGAKRLAYPSIVAGGANATCLHYHHNNEKVPADALLLVDAGGEYEYYASDITRTFPVSAQFSREQAAIYDLVLEAQQKTIQAIRPGQTLAGLHRVASLVLAQGLIDMKVLGGSPEEVVDSGEIKRIYPHGTGHWIGLDVHDTNPATEPENSTEPRVLKPGMCFTVEPGLYFQMNDSKAPESLRGIGIRIEEDVVVTEDGVEVLTTDVPNVRSEIEAIRSKALRSK